MDGPGALRVVPLTLGWVELPITVSLHGDTTGRRLREPVPAVLVETKQGWVLLDTGPNPALFADAPLYRRFHGRDPDIRSTLPGTGDPLLEELARAGLGLSDIVAVGISHLHWDHAGGIRHFAATGAPVYLQRAELEYGLSAQPGPEANGMFRIDYDDPAIDWHLAGGDTTIAPGVSAVSSAGHTPGHQSFVVDIAEEAGGGGFVFACDAADLTDNIENEVPVGGFIGCSPEDTVGSIRRLKALAADKGYRVVPGHDPVAWVALTAELSARWP